MKGLLGCDEGVILEEKGEEFGFDSKDDEVVPRVEEVPLVDGDLDGAFGGVEMMIFLWVKVEAMDVLRIEDKEEDDDEE
ncbi:hypothetical protein Tco_1226571 [Tanacetum coccineum]